MEWRDCLTNSQEKKEESGGRHVEESRRGRRDSGTIGGHGGRVEVYIAGQIE